MGDQEIYEDVDDAFGKKAAFGSCFPNPIWYHGKLNRRKSEDALKGTPSGTYLVRDSTSSPADFVMSVSESTRVSHYQVSREPDGMYNIGDVRFSNLPEIIDFYRIHLLDTAVLTAPLPLEGHAKGGNLNPRWIYKVECMYNFVARDTEDLSFRKGDLLHILEEHEEEWWKAQNIANYAIGCVPVNYIKIVARGPAAPPLNAPKPKPIPKPAPPPEDFGFEEPPPVVVREAPPPKKVEPRKPAAVVPREEPKPPKKVEPVRPRTPSPPPVPEKLPERPKFMVARAILDRNANAYDPSALCFKENQNIQILKQNENGLWEGKIVGGDGKIGVFPFTMVELMDSAEYDDEINKLEIQFEYEMDEIYN